jgi:hypothetical protein
MGIELRSVSRALKPTLLTSQAEARSTGKHGYTRILEDEQPECDKLKMLANCKCSDHAQSAEQGPGLDLLHGKRRTALIEIAQARRKAFRIKRRNKNH